MKTNLTFLIYFLILLPTPGSMAGVINPMSFGDARNSCFLPFTGKPGGTIIWSETCSLQTPRNLTLYKNQLVLKSRGGVEVRSTTDGSHLWNAQSAFDQSFFCADENIFSIYIKIDSSKRSVNNIESYYTSTASQFIDYVNGESRPAQFDFIGNDIDLLFFSQTKKRIIYLYKSSPQVYSGEGCDSWPIWRLCRYDSLPSFSSKPSCIHSITSIVDEFAFADNRKIVYYLSNGNIFSSSWESCKNSPDQRLPLPEVISFSLDIQGKVVAIVKDTSTSYILRYDPANARKNIIPLPEGKMLQLPPAISTSGIAVCVSSLAVHTVSERSLVWSYSFTKPVDKAFVTILGDSSVLVATDSTLRWISKLGQAIFTLNVHDNITCRPIMDAAGKVYIATEKKILSIGRL